jgi:hypothetical protein
MNKVVVEFASGTRVTFYPKHERVVFDFVDVQGVKVVDLSFDECLRVMQEAGSKRGGDK